MPIMPAREARARLERALRAKAAAHDEVDEKPASRRGDRPASASGARADLTAGLRPPSKKRR